MEKSNSKTANVVHSSSSQELHKHHRSLSQIEMEKVISQMDPAVYSMQEDENTLKLQKAAESFVRQAAKSSNSNEEKIDNQELGSRSEKFNRKTSLQQIENVAERTFEPSSMQTQIQSKLRASTSSNLSFFRQEISSSPKNPVIQIIKASTTSLASAFVSTSELSKPSTVPPSSTSATFLAPKSSTSINLGIPSGSSNDKLHPTIVSPSSNSNLSSQESTKAFKLHSISTFLDNLSQKVFNSESAIQSSSSPTQSPQIDVLRLRRSSSIGSSSPNIRSSSKIDGTPSISSPKMNSAFLEHSHRTGSTLNQMDYNKALGGTTVFVLGPNHRIRIFAHEVLCSKYYRMTMLLLIVSQWVIYASQKWDPTFNYEPYFGQFIQDYLLLPIFIIYTFDILLYIISYGVFPQDWSNDIASLWKGSKASIKNSREKTPAIFNETIRIMDCISVCSYWIYLILMSRSLKILRLLWLTPGLTVMTRSITESSKLIQKVMIFLLFFFVIFGLLGVQFFAGSLSRRCVVPIGDSYIKATPLSACGGYYLPNGSSIGITITGEQITGKGYVCPFGQICQIVSTVDERPNGFLSYDNIAASFYTVFITISQEGWTDTMYKTMDAEYGTAAIFHVAIILLIEMILMSLLVAVITQTFSVLHASYRESLVRERKLRAKIIKEKKEQEKVSTDHRFYWLFTKAKKVKQSSWFKISVFVATNMSLISLLLQKAYENQKNAFFCDGKLSSLNQKARILDLVLLIGSFFYLLPSTFMKERYEGLTLFQIIRFYKVVPLTPRIPRVISTAFGNPRDLFNAFLFFIFMVTLCGTIGTQYFGGRMSFLGSGQPTMAWNSIIDGFLTTFKIMVSDNWTDALYNALYIQYGFLFGFIMSSIFFMIVFVMMHSIMIAVAVAVILENFELNEEEKRYGQVLQLVDQLEQKKLKATASYFSKWNIYRYLKPSPEFLHIANYPKKAHPRIRAAQFYNFIYSNTTTNPEEKSDQTIFQKLKSLLDLLFVRTYNFASKSKLYLSNLSLSEKPGSSSVDTLERKGIDPSEIANLISAETKKKSENKSRNPNLHVLDPFIDDVVQNGNTDFFGERAAAINEFKEIHPMYDTTYFIFRPTNPIRMFCKKLSDGKYRSVFNWIIIISTIVSTFALAYESPFLRLQSLKKELSGYTSRYNITFDDIPLLNPDVELKQILVSSEYMSNYYYISETLFAFVFIIEFFVKTIADGVLLTPNAYFYNGWNILDFIILVSMLLGLTTKSVGSTGVPRLIRAVRASRPLRLINHSKSLKSIIDVVFRSLPQIFDSIILALFFMIPFGVFGVVLFNDTFDSCNDTSVNSKFDCIGSFTDDNGILQPRVWGIFVGSFQNIFHAVMSLFEMIMEEGWQDIVQAAIMYRGANLQPEWPPKSWNNYFYFIAWMMFGWVLLRNLFVGVILQTFMTKNGIALLTVEQRQWIELQRQLKLLKPAKKVDPPTEDSFGLNTFSYKMTKDKDGKFSIFITSVIFVNIFTMFLDFLNISIDASGNYVYVPKSQIITNFEEYMYLSCLLAFAAELVFKISGQGFKKWYANRWNWYDCFVVICLFPICFIRLINIDEIFPSSRYTIYQFQKMILILASLRLLGRIPLLKKLFKTIIASFWSIINIMAVLFLFFAVYSLICMEIFGLTKMGPLQGRYANFRDIGYTLLTLFRMTTGENWNSLMREFMVEAPTCTENPYTYLLSDCGSKSWALGIFLSFQIVMTLIMINLFVVTVIDHFDFSQQQDALFTLLTNEDLKHFKEQWAVIDPKGTGYIKKSDLARFLRLLDGKLSVKIYDDAYHVLSIGKILKTTSKIANIKSKIRESPSIVDENFKPEKKNPIMNKNTDEKLSFANLFSPLLSSTPPTGTNPRTRTVELNEYMDLINEKLQTLDVVSTRERRRCYNFVYQEVLSYEDQGKGLPFDKVLRVLSYNLINPEQYLKIDQMFQRQQEINKVQDLVNREKIRALFTTIAIRKRYRLLTGKRAPTMNRRSPPKSATATMDRARMAFGKTSISRVTATINSKQTLMKDESSPKIPLIVVGEEDSGMKRPTTSSSFFTDPSSNSSASMSYFYGESQISVRSGSDIGDDLNKSFSENETSLEALRNSVWFDMLEDPSD